MNSNTPCILVTGAARRIGRALVLALHQAGYKVVLHAHRSHQQAQAIADRLNAERADSAAVLLADLNDHHAVLELGQHAIAAFGRLDALINNASSFYPTPLADTDETQWQDLMASNLKAPYFLIQQTAAELARNRGCVINIADIFGERPMPRHSIYSMAKAANRMLTQALAQELAPDVRVNGIAPGAILWPEDDQGQEITNPAKLDLIPLQRLGGADAICQAALYLLQQAPYTTGQILAVDGGRSLNQ